MSWSNGIEINTTAQGGQVVKTSQPVAFTSFNGYLFFAWRGEDSNLYLSTSSDGENWSRGNLIKMQRDFDGNGRVQLFSPKTKNGPTLVEFSGKLFLAWNEETDNDKIWYSSTSDPANKWLQGNVLCEPITSVDTSNQTVNMTVLNNILYMVWDASTFDGVCISKLTN